MQNVKAKKHLGQHFLTDETIAQQIVQSLNSLSSHNCVLEIGPGMGVLTKYLLQDKAIDLKIIELDRESILYLKQHYPQLNCIEGDFLQLNLNDIFSNSPFSIIGNFPYNISTEILFKILENKNSVPVVVGMFQKEVAERVASKPGNKTYGVTSVLLQAWYSIEYLFTVNENAFSPPPKVKSAVIRLERNNVHDLGCDEKLFTKVVKAGFNQRRKTLRNALRAQFGKGDWELYAMEYLDKRAEQLSVSQFVELTNALTEK